MMKPNKAIKWIGTSLEDIKKFPEPTKREVGFQLSKVQQGEDPDNWKPFYIVGAGVKEIRISEDNGTYRVMYVAKFEEAIYVLHAFQKKSQTTSKHDKDIVSTRYNAIIAQRNKS
ncbi:MAG: type II toxin-antitoxin system RelE/ParE family toxin [Thiotrichaceae bacterium]|nr:type II toxin-antitoxin system RelE/ParE family toxin [Thiotrichaceae bacterium]